MHFRILSDLVWAQRTGVDYTRWFLKVYAIHTFNPHLYAGLIGIAWPASVTLSANGQLM